MSQKVKSAILALVGKSPGLRWGLAGLTRKRAFRAVCGTDDEKQLSELGRADAERILPLINESSKLLDVGCGVGRVESFLSSRCQSIDAIDVSARMISIARNRTLPASNLRFSKANATSLNSFSTEAFDLCFSFHCLEHMDKERAWLALKEIYRVSKRGGIAYLHFPSFLSETYFSLFKEKKHWADKYRVRSYTLPEVDKMVTSVGFKIVRHETACLNPFITPLEPDRDILVTLTK